MQFQPIARDVPSFDHATGAGPVAPSYADVASPRLVSPLWLLIRRLRQDDRPALAAHLIALPREDRRTRFGGNASEATIRRHCDDLNLEETACFAALDGAGHVIGAAFGFIYATGQGRQCVEIAVSVAPEYRRRGLGADLVTRVCETVANIGAAAAVFEFDPSNTAIQALVRSLGGSVPPFADSCTIPLSAPHLSA